MDEKGYRKSICDKDKIIILTNKTVIMIEYYSKGNNKFTSDVVFIIGLLNLALMKYLDDIIIRILYLLIRDNNTCNLLMKKTKF